MILQVLVAVADDLLRPRASTPLPPWATTFQRRASNRAESSAATSKAYADRRAVDADNDRAREGSGFARDQHRARRLVHELGSRRPDDDARRLPGACEPTTIRRSPSRSASLISPSQAGPRTTRCVAPGRRPRLGRRRTRLPCARPSRGSRRESCQRCLRQTRASRRTRRGRSTHLPTRVPSPPDAPPHRRGSVDPDEHAIKDARCSGFVVEFVKSGGIGPSPPVNRRVIASAADRLPSETS